MPRSLSRTRVGASPAGGVDFLGAAAAASPHGLMGVRAGVVVYANPALVRMAGLRRLEDVLGQRVAAVPRWLTTGGPPPAANGSAAEFAVHRMRFRARRAPLDMYVVRNVSDQKRLEQRLRESEKMEALGRLVGGVAHDFNNLLTAITLYSDLLVEHSPQPPRRELEEIRLAAQRGSALVQQLLGFARQQPSTPRVVALNELVESMKGMLQPLLGENIELVLDFGREPANLRADAAQMQQVILNLVMNARDAMPQGGRLRIETSSCRLSAAAAARHDPALRPGAYVNLSVVDTGCGMDEQVRAHIFEPFFTTKRNGSGTGLGMAMVYGIVKQSGGSVAVHSKPGKGTRVTVLLPRVGEASAVRPPLVPAARAGSETVLLAEDDHAVRTSIAHLLSESGYRVLQARDGREAVRLARSHGAPIHLLLSDVVMPGPSGCDTAREVRRLHPETRVLFISGYPAQARAAVAGHPLLYKPFSRAVLAQKVRAVLDHRPAAAGAAAGH